MNMKKIKGKQNDGNGIVVGDLVGSGGSREGKVDKRWQNEKKSVRNRIPDMLSGF